MKIYVVIDDCLGIEGTKDKFFYVALNYEAAKRKVVKLYEQALEDAGITPADIDDFGCVEVNSVKYHAYLNEDEAYGEIYNERDFNEYISVHRQEALS